ncbi:hypothetical protein BYT27DRAFT_6453331 [Phlegmacium glaucopus]|nr:hypothetical protein BYT27DRAFT_6453331 [Phlegmacium glaucopus]
MFDTEEREVIQRLVDIGFNEKQVIEAYLVSDKNEDHAINYLLSTDAKSPSDAHAEQANEDPIEFLNYPLVYRQVITQVIEQEDPALAQQIKQNPALFEAMLQEITLEESALTSGENMAVGRMEELGFDRQKAVDAYLICDKNEEHAINYLINKPDSGLDDSSVMVLPEGSGQVPDHDTPSGFNEEQVIEAYLASNKNEDHAINYLLGTDAESPSDAHAEQANEDPIELLNNPLYRQVVTQMIGQEDPALAQQLKQNPALFEAALQEITLEESVLTSGENMAVGRMEELGFDRQKAVDAYLICDKNEEHAINYLINEPDSGLDDSSVVIFSSPMIWRHLIINTFIDGSTRGVWSSSRS